MITSCASDTVATEVAKALDIDAFDINDNHNKEARKVY